MPVINKDSISIIIETTKNDAFNEGVAKIFFKYDKTPNTNIVFCDNYQISNLRTPIFVHNNIFGGDNIEDEIIFKSHYIILLGDAEGNELVTENDFSFLVNEFCG